MTVGNKVTAYTYNKNDELLRTGTLNTDTEDSVVIYKYNKNENQLVTVNHYHAENQLTQTLTKNYKGEDSEKRYYVTDTHGNVLQLT